MRRLLLVFVLVLAAGLTGSTAAKTTSPEIRDPTWSPDGTLLAYVRTIGPTGQIFVVGFDGRGRRAVGPRFRSPYGLTWSPDGRSVALASGGDIRRVEVESGALLRLTNAPELEAFQPAWSPDGKTIAYAVFEGCFRCTRIYGIDPTGVGRRLLADGLRRPAWWRDSSLLLASSPVTLVDTVTGESREIAGGSYATWSGDRSEFVYAGDGGLYVSTAARVAPQLVWPIRGELPAHPTLSPQHLWIAAVRGRRVVLFRRYLRTQAVFPRSDSANDAPVWSFRGQLAFVADGPCGPRSEIDVVRSDGSRRHALVRSCRP